MARVQETSFLALVSAVGLAASAPGQTPGQILSVDVIVNRMTQARAENRARFRPYSVRREYTLLDHEAPEPKSQVIADVTFFPPNKKQYAIRQVAGSGLAEKIVRHLLDKESELAREPGVADVSPDNYDFRFIREESTNGRCYVLELIPKRKGKDLVRGRIWVDAATFLPRQAEGEPVKSPSWWVREARVRLAFGDVDGMWLQTSSEATAEVRILGPFTLISRDVEYTLGQVAAETNTPRIVLASSIPSLGLLATPRGR